MKKILAGIIVLGMTSFFSQAANPADMDNDGKVSLAEFLVHKKQLCIRDGTPYREEVLKELFVKKDLDHDGFLSFEELKAVPPKILG